MFAKAKPSPAPATTAAENETTVVDPHDAASGQKARLVDVIELIYGGQEVFFRFIREVGDLMTTDVETLSLDQKIGDGLAFMKEQAVRHILLVDEVASPNGGTAKKILIGIVSRRDISRCLSRGAGSPVQTEADDKLLKQPLGTIVTRNVSTVTPRTSIFDAVKLMLDKKIDCLPVVIGSPKELTPVGILTSTDIIKCFLHLEVLRRAREAKPKAARIIDFVSTTSANAQPIELLVESLMGRVADVMQDEVVTVNVDAPLSDAMRLMQDHQIRHLPVIDKENRLKGILSDRDVLAALPVVEKKGRRETPAAPKFREELFYADPNDAETRKVLAERVSTAMTGQPVTVDATTPLVKLVDVLLSRRIGAVPVIVSGEVGVRGIVTQTDILRAILALGRLLHIAEQPHVAAAQ